MEQSLIWEHFQNVRPDSFAQAAPRHRFLISRCRPGRILNVGVGDGGLERLAVTQEYELHSLDPNTDALAGLSRVSRGVAGNIVHLPFGDSVFDTIICSEVLEHLDDRALCAALKEIVRVLKNGGLLVGTVPADERLVDSETVCPCCGHVFHRWGHVQSFSRSRLQQLLSPIGPAIVERRLFVHWASLNAKGKVAALIKKCLSLLGTDGTGYNYYFNVRKNG